MGFSSSSSPSPPSSPSSPSSFLFSRKSLRSGDGKRETGAGVLKGSVSLLERTRGVSQLLWWREICSGERQNEPVREAKVVRVWTFGRKLTSPRSLRKQRRGSRQWRAALYLNSLHLHLPARSTKSLVIFNDGQVSHCGERRKKEGQLMNQFQIINRHKPGR